MDRGERRFRTSKVVKKRMVFLKKMYAGKTIPQKMVGRCRRVHPHDCGHTNCYVCHCDKLDRIPTRQEVESDLKMKEELQ
jgi:hypothetical protein